MSPDQTAVLAILGATFAGFVWNRWRYDIVAVSSLVCCVLLGLVEPDQALAGFSSPAVITVAAVLTISSALSRSGSIDILIGQLILHRGTRLAHLACFTMLGAFLSAFMNNVAALALVMPVAISTARRHGYAPSVLLMPLSFATLLGGMTTLIGTPANLLIAGFREETTGDRFAIFDFTPIGLLVCAVGLLYLLLIGRRLLPVDRKAETGALFEIKDYVTEVRICRASGLPGLGVADYEASRNLQVLGIIRHGQRLFGRVQLAVLQQDDILLLQADTAALEGTIKADRLEIVERSEPFRGATELVEAVVLPDAVIQGSSPRSLNLPHRYRINLIAASRQGRLIEGRLGDANLSTGDILLLEGPADRVREALVDLGCLPLERRMLGFLPRRLVVPVLLFTLGILASALGLLSTAVAFTCVILLMVLMQVIEPARLYDSVNWPVVVLLGAMIPVGTALQDTGAATQIATRILLILGDLGPHLILGATLIVTMLITPVLNNAATVVVMAPVVISIAARLDVSPDPFLMATAIGASCDFLTPFGHHNNTIVMGPGGYGLKDYWRVGLGLELVVLVIAWLALPLVWPF